MQGKNEIVTHIILVGASNMRRTAQHIKDLGLRVTEYPLKGGIPNDDAIDQVTTFLGGVASEGGAVVVFDLLGSFSYRFEQADGNMALPIWLGGKPHLLGKVGVCSDRTFKDMVTKLILSSSSNYLFSFYYYTTVFIRTKKKTRKLMDDYLH